MNGENTILLAASDDTIELQLTAEQLLDLWHAAEAAERTTPAQMPAVVEPGPVSPALSSPQPLFKVNSTSSSPRWQWTPTAKVAATVVAYAAFAWWSASEFAKELQPRPHVVAKPIVAIPRAAVAATSSAPDVQIVNPFDATEVFQFPPGSSKDESREKVAQILLQRARERQGQWIRPDSERFATVSR